MDSAIPLQIIQKMLAPASLRPDSEQVMLLADRRQFLKRRWRGTAVDGTEFGFDLIERLTNGSVIHAFDGRDYVIRQLPELVYALEFDEPGFAALAGWKLGNLHMPVEVLPGSLRTLPDPAVRQLFEREGWTRQELTVLFNPLRAMAHAS